MKPGGHYVAGGVDAAGRLGVGQCADGLDTAAGDANVGVESGLAGAVHHGAVQYEGVECHGLSPEG